MHLIPGLVVSLAFPLGSLCLAGRGGALQPEGAHTTQMGDAPDTSQKHTHAHDLLQTPGLL